MPALLRIISSLSCVLISTASVWGQFISGVINDYSPVVGISGKQLTVSSPTLFAAGDHVLLMQMQGADIITTNNASFGDVSAYHEAGNFEFGVVAAVNGSVVELKDSLTRSYNVTGSVQLIRVPDYCAATVADTLTCKPWDGSTGGVLALICYGTLTLQQVVDVSGKGFRGGPTCVGPWGCGNTMYYLNNTSCSGGKKGEGIYLISNNAYTGGRGKIANGGGGGNPGNCGGGGGANYGAGGLGGYEYNLCFNTIQGIGGQALDYTLGKIFMGGAGGTGFNDNMQTQFPGSNGGGIVIIVCDTLIGNGYSIVANGDDVGGTTSDESAGGGGAGGVICLAAKEVQGPLTLKAEGGRGGDTFNNIFVGQCHGPGGGGGGGVIWLASASIPTGITTLVNGGPSGLVLNPLSTCYNTGWGATAGGNGAVLFNFNGINVNPPAKVALAADTTVCPGQQVVLHAGSGFFSYLWNNGSTDSLLVAAAPGTYHVTVSDSAGCVSSDTVVISVFPPMTVNLLLDTTICPGDSLLLVAGDMSHTYWWNTGSADSSIWAAAAGLYWVEVTDSLGCVVKDSLWLSHHPLQLLELGDDFSICQNDSAIVYAGNYAEYWWNTGVADSAITIKVPGLYWVAVTDDNGCRQADSVRLLILYPLPPKNLIADTLVCPGVDLLIQAPEGFQDYLWSTAHSLPAEIFNQPGVYWLEVTNEYGCRNRDTFLLEPECPTDIWFPNAFSPNGDHINDIYRPIGYNITNFRMVIFNRWGQSVFTTDRMDRGWDGMCNGVPCEIGVYVYHAEFSGELHGIVSSGRRQGNITLIR